MQVSAALFALPDCDRDYWKLISDEISEIDEHRTIASARSGEESKERSFSSTRFRIMTRQCGAEGRAGLGGKTVC
jgi:hypothetical protein